MKKQTFVRGVAILFVASVFAKILGAVYRVPLTWILGAEGLGIYQLVYPLYSLIIVLSSTGMPTAISKTVASYNKQGDYISAQKTFRVSLILLSIIGLIFALALALLAHTFASLQGNVNCYICYLGLVPAVIFVSILSAFRGYFQGQANMTPTAVSQVVEQVAKLIFGLTGGFLLNKYGVEYGAFGALVGVSISELIAVLVMFAVYAKDRKLRYYSAQNGMHSTINNTLATSQNLALASQKWDNNSGKKIARKLIITAVPIVLANAILPLVLFVESIFVIKLLGISGLTVGDATKLWGINSGVVNSLINMPIVLAQSIAISIVPFVAGELDMHKTQARYNQAIGLGIMFCVPVFVCFVLLGNSVISILYQSSLNSAETLIAVKMLSVSSASIIFGTILQIQNSMMQGLGFGKVTFVNMAIGAVIQIGLFVGLCSSDLNIWGCVVASVSFYIITYLLNWIFIRRKLGLILCFKNLWPVFSGAILLVLFVINVVWLVPNMLLALVISIVGGGGLYLFSLWVFDGFAKLGLKGLKLGKKIV